MKWPLLFILLFCYGTFHRFEGTAISLPIAVAAEPANTFYISPSGNDANACTLVFPCQTLSRAETLAKASAAHILARAGTYTLAATLAFTSVDNGETWSAYPGETPIIDGGGSYDLSFTNIRRFTMAGFTFQHMGQYSIKLSGGTYTFQSNTFMNCKVACIYGPAVQRSVIDSNTMNGQAGGQGTIQLFYGSSGNRIAHNLIENTQGAAIDLDDGQTDPRLDNNVIDRNKLVNNNQTWKDMGAIYLSDRTHRGVNTITNNLITGNAGTSATSIKCIYLDDFSSDTTVTGNICGTAGKNQAYGIQVHGGNDNNISNNIFNIPSGAQWVFYQSSSFGHIGMTGNVFSHNVIYSSESFSSSLWDVRLTGGDAPPSNTTNLYYSGSGASISNRGIPDLNPVYSNPQFNDAGSDDYHMPSTSPAYTAVGIVPFATDQGPLPQPPIAPLQ